MGGHQHFKDHFSQGAADYAAYRPHYPRSLVEFLASETPGHKLVWEAGCGNGQLSGLLAERFDQVIASDASASQIKSAVPRENVDYRVAPAEASGLEDKSVDLAVAAQAAHWFDLDAYYGEVRRVVKPGGVLALVTYNLFKIEPGIDELILRFYNGASHSFWPPERILVETAYASMPFPFPRIESPKLEMTQTWNLAQVIGYITTWSALKPFIKARGKAEFDHFCEELLHAWGPASVTRPIHWPLTAIVGRV